MQVSKWDFYMVLKIPQTEIKKMMSLLSKELDPV